MLYALVLVLMVFLQPVVAAAAGRIKKAACQVCKPLKGKSVQGRGYSL